MIAEIFIYFFLVFGILQFSVCIWEYFTEKKIREYAFLVVKPSESENYPEVCRLLKKYPFDIYAISEDAPDITVTQEDFNIITRQQLIKKLGS